MHIKQDQTKCCFLIIIAKTTEQQDKVVLTVAVNVPIGTYACN